MTPSTDPRRARTRALLERTVLELLHERDLGQITASDIAHRAAVGRSTLYDHYGDVTRLAASACTDMFDELLRKTPVLIGGRAPLHAHLTSLFVHIGEHRRLYGGLLGPNGSAAVIDHLHRRITVAIHVNMLPVSTRRTHGQDPTEIVFDGQAAFLAGGLLGTATAWLQAGCPDSPESIATALLGTLRPT